MPTGAGCVGIGAGIGAGIGDGAAQDGRERMVAATASPIAGTI